MLAATDSETTTDIQEENTVDLTPKVGDGTLAADSSAPDVPEATVSIPSECGPENDPHAADALTTHDLPLEPMPKRRAWGFFVFVGCAVTLTVVATQWQTESAHVESGASLSAIPLPLADALGDSPRAALPVRTGAAATSVALSKAGTSGFKLAAMPAPGAMAKSEIAGAGATVSVVTFESRSFDTSERAVAAVFIVKRTRAPRGRVFVQWAAYSGSADAGIDFSDASGTVRFADGQRQLAIYVPLRNDLLKEEDETFKVCLGALQQAPVGATSCAEATIRDDETVRL